jgi:catechol 2,3-dioxygenase-like lactoylglutathione lyase family enzyme
VSNDPVRRLLRVHHAQITIPTGQEAPAKAFYCGVLGLTEIEKPAALQSRGGFWLAASPGDQFQVHIGTEDGVNRQATKAHLAYEVRDLSAWRRRLETAGVKILESIPLPGYDRFEFRDPFGNRVELIEPLE